MHLAQYASTMMITGDNYLDGRRALANALQQIAAAASHGCYDLQLTEIERSIGQLVKGTTARVLVRSGGGWRNWDSLDGGPGGTRIELPDESLGWDSIRVVENGVFIPVSVGAVCLLFSGETAQLEALPELEILRHAVGLALQNAEMQRVATQSLDEAQTLQRVATQMLKSHDLSEIFLLITQEAKRLLSSDICGVLLREGEEIVMRRCVGHHSVDTASLRIKPGQGLAGRVLARREPSAVEDYIESHIISRHFFHLAKAELVRSALAVPLVGRDEVIGVLEVWRRRPLTFTTHDSSRLVALANLASIAIENANLYATQRSIVEELGRANWALNQRFDTVRNLSNLTQRLMQILLHGGGLPAIIACASSFLGADVAIIDVSGHLRAWAGPTDGALLRELLVTALVRAAATPKLATASRLELIDHSRWLAQPLLVEGETIGWVLGRVQDQVADLTELAVSQVAIVAALDHVEQRAASRARAETIDALVWDLLQGEEAVQSASIDRAREIKINLDETLRLFVCELGPCRDWNADRSASVVRKKITMAIRQSKPAQSEHIRAIALRGHLIAIVCSDETLEDAERWAEKLARHISQQLEGRLVLVGGSGLCTEARGLAAGYREAQIALDVARQLGRSGAIVYDHAGVVGMLLSLRHEVGMQRFLQMTFGELLTRDDRQRDPLLETLRVYFDLNGSQEAAAQRLGVHRKTISYRLAKISKLTGLDFSTHEDRLRADLALYIYRLIEDRRP